MFANNVWLSYEVMKDLDIRCEELIKEEFDARCNFDVDDAVGKLEKLGIVGRVNLLFEFPVFLTYSI